MGVTTQPSKRRREEMEDEEGANNIEKKAKDLEGRVQVIEESFTRPVGQQL